MRKLKFRDASTPCRVQINGTNPAQLRGTLIPRSNPIYKDPRYSRLLCKGARGDSGRKRREMLIRPDGSPLLPLVIRIDELWVIE